MVRRLTLDFLKTETASGGILVLAAIAALLVANSPWSAEYFAWLKSTYAVQVGPFRVEDSITGWIKDGLMAVFFLVVGLEIKHEILRGELSDPRKLATPILAALGGMVGPALVYFVVAGMIGAPHGAWPVPLATDIAFALAVFALVGKGLPPSLRIFLLTLAIVDDLGAILLIAVLFSGGAHWPSLGAAAALLAAIGLVAHRVRLPSSVWVIGFAAIWYLTFQSSLSTSLTAVAFAVIVPIKARKENHQSPLKEAMHELHPYNAFLILPLFAFTKAGVSFAGMTMAQVFAPLAVAVAMGLFFGKQIGVFGAAWIAQKCKIGERPTDASWRQVYGVALLCGVGFTMSLFIGALAIPGAIDSPQQVEIKLGVIGGSVLSALAGALVLRGASGPRAIKESVAGGSKAPA